MVNPLMHAALMGFLSIVLAGSADTTTRDLALEENESSPPWSVDPMGDIAAEAELLADRTDAILGNQDPRSNSSPERESTADSSIGNSFSDDKSFSLRSKQGKVPPLDSPRHEHPASPQLESDPNEDIEVDARGRKFLRALDPMDHSFDFDAFFTSDRNNGAKTACQEDVKLCRHALTTMHCLANHLYELTESCMHAVEANLPAFCAIEIDRHKCNGLDSPVVLCLTNHADDLSDECGQAQNICHHLMVIRKSKQLPRDIRNTELVQFSGCPIDLVKVVDSNQCCSYDSVALDTHCQLPTLHECVKQICEIEGTGLMSATVVEAPEPHRKTWSYRCCPYDAANGLAELMLRQSFHSRTQFFLILLGIACVLILVLYIGPQLDSVLLRQAPFYLNHKSDRTIDYGTVPMEARDSPYDEEFLSMSAPL
eukprot:GEMP01027503.1.p1 GENE.GEMP01027503.1~~GEMP01027503.1.p1  ORF type:complete len:426 (+),score=55.80 GEMP01027503.1:139-1416(+)